jgi:class 3 adenylate cyclase
MMAILFTDLVGSTEMLERLGEDAAEELRRTHFGLLRQAVGEAGGQEVKNLGDGLMVTFPSSLQAVACAVAMQRAVAGHNLEEPGRALEIRVGLHLGEPVADEDDFFGTSVVVAKRLCDRAEGNQILASVLVATVVGSRGGYRFRSLGRVALKGLAEPLAAVAVEWQAESPARPVGPAPVTPPTTRRRAPRGPRLVGRERELDVLEAELERAGAGEFSCVLVVGEPGVGKTRLASELLARHRNHILGLSARAYPLGTTASFGLWAEALERHLRGLAPTEVSRLCGGFLGDLAGLLRSVAAAHGSVPEEEVPRLNLLEGLAVVLFHLARGSDDAGRAR